LNLLGDNYTVRYKKKVIVTDDKTTPEARARRLRRIRNMANLSRKQMCSDPSLNICTYKGWEVARYGGLPIDGAERVAKRVAEEGVVCSVEWLLYEIGQGPYIIPDFNKAKLDKTKTTPKNISLPSEEERIVQEILVFRQYFPEVIDYQIADDGIIPFYAPGDFVAGSKCFGEKINTLLNQYCIVQTTDGKILVRFLKAGSAPNKFMLLCTNSQTTVNNPTLYDVELASAAPILRHYRKFNHSAP